MGGADELIIVQRPHDGYSVLFRLVDYRRGELKIYVVEVDDVGLKGVEHPAELFLRLKGIYDFKGIGKLFKGGGVKIHVSRVFADLVFDGVFFVKHSEILNLVAELLKLLSDAQHIAFCSASRV